MTTIHIAATIIQDAWINYKYPGERFCPQCDTYNHVYHMERICCSECGYIWRPTNSPPPPPLSSTDNSSNFSDDVLIQSLNLIPLTETEKARIYHVQYCKNCWYNWETKLNTIDHTMLGLTVDAFTTDPNLFIVDLNKISSGCQAVSCLDYDAFALHEYESDAE